MLVFKFAFICIFYAKFCSNVEIYAESNYETSLGGLLSINCKSNATIIKWQQFRSDQYKDINSDNQKYFIQLDHDRNVSTLVINNLNLNDLVFYKCFDVNGYFSEFNLKEKTHFSNSIFTFLIELFLDFIPSFFELSFNPENFYPTHDNADAKIANKQPEQQNCGVQKIKPHLISKRIIHGSRAQPYSWPWVVSIAYEGPQGSIKHACGGVLVNKRHILTATHCVSENDIYDIVGYPVEDSSDYKSLSQMIRVYAGINSRSADINPNKTFYAQKITHYPSFEDSTFQNDISIIRLSRDVEESDEIGFICLSQDMDLQADDDFYIAGWGITERNHLSDYLRQARVSVFKENECKLTYYANSQFCGGNKQLGLDSCTGDSGGPAMKKNKNLWTLVGIMSNGDQYCTGNGIYTNVSYFHSWIIDNIKL